MVFATRLLRDGAAARIGLVPCAVGGTEMDRWMPDADLYEHMVRPCALCHVQCLAKLVTTCMSTWCGPGPAMCTVIYPQSQAQTLTKT